MPGATCTSACASMGMGAACTHGGAGGIIPFGIDVLVFSGLHAPVDSARAVGWSGMIYFHARQHRPRWKTARPPGRSDTVGRASRDPRLVVIRPGDANETAVACGSPIETRAGSGGSGADAAKRCRLSTGLNSPRPTAAPSAYVLADAPDGRPDLVLIGTGSEVSLAVAARRKLSEAKDSSARRFDAQLGAVRPAAERVSRLGFAGVNQDGGVRSGKRRLAVRASIPSATAVTSAKPSRDTLFGCRSNSSQLGIETTPRLNLSLR